MTRAFDQVQPSYSSYQHGPGDPLWLANCLYDVRMRASDTNGRMTLVDITSPSNNRIAPPHQHLEADELIYVLYGRLWVHTATGESFFGEQIHELGPGEFVFMPKGTTEWMYTREEETKAIFIFTPSGGSDEFFDAVGLRGYHSLPPHGESERAIELLREESARAKFQEVPDSPQARDTSYRSPGRSK
jgi:quercetin dioxygenase-like cupin family protein